jgi:hypothetical protein
VRSHDAVTSDLGVLEVLALSLLCSVSLDTHRCVGENQYNATHHSAGVAPCHFLLHPAANAASTKKKGPCEDTAATSQGAPRHVYGELCDVERKLHRTPTSAHKYNTTIHKKKYSTINRDDVQDDTLRTLQRLTQQCNHIQHHILNEGRTSGHKWNYYHAPSMDLSTNAMIAKKHAQPIR